jgi:hypothetical protein
MQTRQGIMILLLLAIVPTMLTIQQAYSQSVVTSTTVYTATSTLYAQTSTIVASSVTTGARKARYCFYDYVYGDLNSGEKLSGSLSSNVKINFYIMTEQQAQFLPGFECDSIPPHLLAKLDVVSYSFEWAAPQDGRYYFVIWNPRVSQSYVYSLALWKSSTATFTFYSTSYPMQASASPTTSFYTSPSPNTSLQVSSNSQWPSQAVLLTIGLVVGIAIVGYALLRSLRSGGSKAAQRASTQFCINCGASLPAGSKYCSKCGTPQS